MYILGIETSCDDTCISVLKSQIPSTKSQTKGVNFKILSNVISSQVKLHAKYGGVYPFLAKREHQKNLPIVLKKALKEANFSISNFQFLISKKNPNANVSPKAKQFKIQNSKFKIQNLDMIAVTVGPGLEPCLWTGINFAKELAKKLKIPLVPVNHLEAHILANFVGEKSQIPLSRKQKFSRNLNLKSKIQNSKTIFPAICLVVSGGNTQLILMREIGQYKILGETRDDAAGECFDKTARILGLGYPGGPAIAAEAAKFKILNLKFKIVLPRPMIYQKNYDFSFSGLKTAVLYQIKDSRFKIKDKEYVQAMAFEIQQAIIDVLIYKTIKAVKDYKAKSIILGGGVAANDELRRQFILNLKSKILNLNFLVPPKNLCADNAAMIAATAFFHQDKATRDLKKNKANGNLKL
ncbi:MAG: tRNA (adenosine(37)-N6)-threonylcarbamoyltransferase complex transferase subunit TsaD [Candidatus Nealsonbacteria bacterium CG08_land_8_20_14_0_20_38_20]|uniref:tRNA N6-adenosine threonylcarbamoyltransferase n=1 Tax=Candidatus Nealsonbacteria bacterium CG08_land_8_20_14_0_20_38_20 TaxID=1974705 RepID=A0A2H0YMD7_9BACT|nr:MAG: tRNA (adenosine(37)-N6)-threonylcarbamoyltransferase complex transferase subunit TsaD [Candidatus Nealsonbacteria bacterium CG08_land_8_20_14_0_20_38_20]